MNKNYEFMNNNTGHMEVRSHRKQEDETFPKGKRKKKGTLMPVLDCFSLAFNFGLLQVELHVGVEFCRS